MALKTTHLFKSKVIAAGTNGDSDVIDMRDVELGECSVSYTIGTSGGVATCGSALLSYLGCAVFDGTYVSPTNGTFGTIGASGGSNIASFTPPPIPFIKIRAAVGTSGTAVVTASLHMR